MAIEDLFVSNDVAKKMNPTKSARVAIMGHGGIGNQIKSMIFDENAFLDHINKDTTVEVKDNLVNPKEIKKIYTPEEVLEFKKLKLGVQDHKQGKKKKGSKKKRK